jgi:hypothetical protein
VQLGWEGLEQAGEQGEDLDRACPALVYVAELADTAQGEVGVGRVFEMVDNLFGLQLRIQPGKHIGEDHLRDPNHTSPSSIRAHALNATPITQPNNPIKLNIEPFLLLANFLINIAQQGN